MLRNSQPEIERFVAKRVCFLVQQSMEVHRFAFRDAADIEVFSANAAGHMIARLKLMLAGDDKREVTKRIVSHPLTWWDHFKLERFPQWLLARFPARMKHHEIECTVDITRVCPHIAVPRDNRALYLHWAFIKDIIHDRDEEAKRS